MFSTMSETQPRKVPKDGPGPRGAPDCYYTSRVLNSTYRYEKFVRKLRALEEDQRRGEQNRLKELKDTQTSDFFIRCDRRSLINNVARRVDLCMASYQDDLNDKRKRLKDLYTNEEEANIRKFVEQVQAGAAAAWQDKVDRLQHLLEKRRKEHEEKYKDPPISKCTHVLPYIYKLRAKEAQEIQLYQMKEKQARRMSEKEFDKMWHEVAMKEADALAARMEYDAMEKARKDLECKNYSDYQLEQRRIQREKEREMLKEETRWFKEIWDMEEKKEMEAERQRADRAKEEANERKKMLEEKHEKQAREMEKEKLVKDTWYTLTNQQLSDDKSMVELRKRKQRELNECNKKLIELKNQYEGIDACLEEDFQKEAQKRQDQMDMKRCELRARLNKSEEVHKAIIDQIRDREKARKILKEKTADENEYQCQLSEQLQRLVDLKQMTDAQARKMYQKDLQEQIQYQKLLKERAKQEELDQFKKFQIASQEYEDELKKMTARPSFSDQVHPFTKRIRQGVAMRHKCPCSRPDYCQ